LRKNWTIDRYRDYAVSPKPDGYRALHLINRHSGRLIEIQLRTPRQDMWANAVEEDARQFDLRLKSGGGPRELRDYYVAIAELFAVRDRGLIDSALYERVERLQARADTFRRERLRAQ
jgi:putative GTP pyrophosphokinase